MSSEVETSLNISGNIERFLHFGRNDRKLKLPARGILALVRLRRGLDSEDRFAFFHQIEPVARDRFQIRRIGLEQIHFTGLAGEQDLLLVALRLKLIDLGVSDFEFFVRWDKHAHDYEPDREQQQEKEDPVPSLPDGSFATRAEIAVTMIHFSGYYRRKSLCHQVLRRFEATDCISQRDRSGKANRF